MEKNFAQQFERLIRQITRDELLLLINSSSCKGVIPLLNTFQAKPIKNKITSKLGWLKGEKSLLLFYNLLFSYGFISCGYDSFKPNFLGSDTNTESIVWIAPIKHLVYIFDRLMADKFIPENRNIHLLLSEHFLDKKGEMLGRGSLRTSLNNVRSSKKNQAIEDLLDKLLDYDKY
jgi:hypothetical protein